MRLKGGANAGHSHDRTPLPTLGIGRILPCFHMTVDAVGGSFQTLTGNVAVGCAHGTNQLIISGNAGSADPCLDPPVIAHCMNEGSSGGFNSKTRI